jgi:flagellar biosynthesis protein FlhA
MNARVDSAGFFANWDLKRLAGPILVVMILAMMILPLPPFLLDLLFTFNIAVAMIVLLISLYLSKPLDFAVFPTVLLLTTLLRLALNVASTRVVLLEGHTGPDAAGKVIEAFGHFLVGGNYAVGIVVFAILVLINFVVITKGAGRIAEVAARFTLDAMPGKQMAIDADLNTGLIGEDEARKRRAVIALEAEFYGAMDGASKFVRGDAVAGIMIMLINIVGGLAIGVLQHDLTLSQALSNYTLLTIGDGLVAQIPALVISTAAGIVVSRVSADQDIGQQIVEQMFMNPQVLYITAAILGLMGIIPGMPHFAFLLLAGGLVWIANNIAKNQRAAKTVTEQTPLPTPPEQLDVSWDDVGRVDTLGLEVGYRLIPLVDRMQDGELLRRIRGIRKKFAQDMGFLVAPVHIRDNLELRPNGYRITVKGVEMGRGESQAGQFLAINPGRVLGQLPGTPTKDPTFGLPAVWIDASLREQAQTYGYTVVDAGTVVATHLSQILQAHAADLLGREEVQQLLDHIGKEAPKLIEDLVPAILPLGTLQRVLQGLLEEGVPIRDMRSILEVLTEHGVRTKNIDELTAAARVGLGRAIIQDIYQNAVELQVIALDPTLEHMLTQAATSDSQGAGLEPSLAEKLLTQTGRLVQEQENRGLPPVLLVPAVLRTLLSRFLRRVAPQLKVLSHAEVPDTKTIKVTAVLGASA